MSRKPDPGADTKLVERALTVDEYQRLRASTGWSQVSRDCAGAGMDRALFSVCAVAGDEVIGCGRVVGDGGLYFYVQDVIVLPEYRGRGIGRSIMSAIMGHIESHARPGAFIGLMAARGYAGFYEKYGFARRPDEAPGMFRVWKPGSP